MQVNIIVGVIDTSWGCVLNIDRDAAAHYRGWGRRWRMSLTIWEIAGFLRIHRINEPDFTVTDIYGYRKIRLQTNTQEAGT